MSKLYLRKYQNNNSKMTKAFGKWFLRAKHLETLNTRELSAHIAKHGSIYTDDVILGVVTKAAGCIAELVQQGYKVKLDGLGTFYLAVTSKGADTAEDLDENAVIYKRLRFQPERSKWSENATVNMTQSARVTTVDPYAVQGSEGGGNSGGSGGGGVEEEP